jgi:general secretion pathway protein G
MLKPGFTLIELLVVLVILVLLASLVAPRVIGYLGSSRSKAARVQVQSLSTALELYKVDTAAILRPAKASRR